MIWFGESGCAGSARLSFPLDLFGPLNRFNGLSVPLLRRGQQHGVHLF